MEMKQFEGEFWIKEGDVLKIIDELKKIIGYFGEITKGDGKEQDELLLNVLFQACGYSENNKDMIDNEGLSVYEWACVYLEEKGYLRKKNDRIYIIVDEGEQDGS